jgi:hypothetical protein
VGDGSPAAPVQAAARACEDAPVRLEHRQRTHLKRALLRTLLTQPCTQSPMLRVQLLTQPPPPPPPPPLLLLLLLLLLLHLIVLVQLQTPARLGSPFIFRKK